MVFLFTIMESCSVVTKTTVISTKEIPKSKKNTETSLSYNVLHTPTIDNPNVKLAINKVEGYTIATKKRVKKERKPSDLTKAFAYGFPIAIAVGVNLIPGVTEDVGARILASLLSAGLCLPFSVMAMKMNSGTRTFWQDGEIKYKIGNAVPFKDNLIRISYSDKFSEFQTNNLGSLFFSPLKDFQIDYSVNNEVKIFSLSHQNTKFIDALKLKPSLWLSHFSKVTTSTTNIWQNYSHDSQSLGKARKGLEYLIVSENNKWSRYKVELFNDKYGWLDFKNVETYYSVDKESDISIAIKNFVEEKMTEWQKQGEFELPDDYYRRMQDREYKVKELTYEAMDLYQKDYKAMISWDDATISRYDPNSQTFKITIPELHEIVVHVPISVAPEYKGNWYNKKVVDKRFMLVDGSWELTSLKIEIPGIDYTAEYNSDLNYSYNPVNQFSFELEPIKIDFSNANTETPADDLLEVKYDISTNLPKTSMNNPDAFGIVIGNSNYKYTTNVDYAINDAQLMKTYLINVLGFKPANVVFRKDASKADFEGYFGTKDNFKGKLHKYIKEDISDVFIFYSGHGAPGISDKKGYFVPVDCDPLYIELQGFQTDILYNNLAKISAKSVSVVLDACFSGLGVIDNISSIIPKVQDPIFQIHDGVLISSSATDEVASWLRQQQHGLFTYFFLKAIHDKESSDINKDNQLTFEEIFNYVSDKTNGVPYFARRINDIQQNPYIKGNSEKVFIKYISK